MCKIVRSFSSDTALNDACMLVYVDVNKTRFFFQKNMPFY